MQDDHGYDVCGPRAMSSPVRLTTGSTSYRTDANSTPERGFSSTNSTNRSNRTESDRSTYSNNNNLVKHNGPKHPHFGPYETRLLTFRDWPQAMPQRPKELAEAGFFYLGRGDQVQCYYCDGGLKNWDPEDLPFEEHARWFGDCGFLQLVKGREYIDRVMTSKPPNGDYLMQEDGVNYEAIKQNAEANSLEQAREAGKANGVRRGDDSGLGSVSTGDLKASEPEETETDVVKENKRLKEERLCKVCLDKEVGVVLIPCGHFTCINCAPALIKCPICRSKIDSAVRTFLS